MLIFQGKQLSMPARAMKFIWAFNICTNISLVIFREKIIFCKLKHAHKAPHYISSCPIYEIKFSLPLKPIKKKYQNHDNYGTTLSSAQINVICKSHQTIKREQRSAETEKLRE